LALSIYSWVEILFHALLYLVENAFFKLKVSNWKYGKSNNLVISVDMYLLIYEMQNKNFFLF